MDLDGAEPQVLLPEPWDRPTSLDLIHLSNLNKDDLIRSGQRLGSCYGTRSRGNREKLEPPLTGKPPRRRQAASKNKESANSDRQPTRRRGEHPRIASSSACGWSQTPSRPLCNAADLHVSDSPAGQDRNVPLAAPINARVARRSAGEAAGGASTGCGARRRDGPDVRNNQPRQGFRARAFDPDSSSQNDTGRSRLSPLTRTHRFCFPVMRSLTVLSPDDGNFTALVLLGFPDELVPPGTRRAPRVKDIGNVVFKLKSLTLNWKNGCFLKRGWDWNS